MRFRPVAPAAAAAGQSSPGAFQSSSSNKANAVSSPPPSSTKMSSKFRPVAHQQEEQSSSRRRSGLPPSSLSPSPSSNKRHKFEPPIEYPLDEEVAVPSKATIKALYQHAVQDDDPHSHQRQLDDQASGLLSLEQVFLPAVVAQEVEALKMVQSKAQRDTPHHVHDLQLCRLVLYHSGQHAIRKAHEARMVRQENHAKELAIRQQEKNLAKEERRVEKEKARLVRRQERAIERAKQEERRKRELKKKLPRNLELWEEVALFMTELTKLEKEERMWKETDANLKNRERELHVREQNRSEEEEEDEQPTTVERHSLHVQVEHAVEDITLSSLRIQQALRLVSGLVSQSNATQKELYETYTKDHQFRGYRGVHNPKALIRALAATD